MLRHRGVQGVNVVDLHHRLLVPTGRQTFASLSREGEATSNTAS